MSRIGPGDRMRRTWRYQFEPSTYNASFQSANGVVERGFPTGGTILPVSISPTASNEYTISSTLTGTLTYLGQFVLKADWLFTMYGSQFSVVDNAMFCRVTSVSYDALTGYSTLNFTAFRSVGEGTFDAWYIIPDLKASYNFVQNDDYSAVNAKCRTTVPTARFVFPTDGEGTFHEITNTNTNKSGYFTTEYKGTCTVYEDQYEYNRPYEGYTITVSRPRTKTVVTTSFTYDPDESSSTTVVSDYPELTHSYTVTSDDYIPYSTDWVSGGNYSSPGGPSPSRQSNKTAQLGSIETFRYAYTYQAYYPDPEDPEPSYRIISAVETSYTISGDGEGTINPGDFF